MSDSLNAAERAAIAEALEAGRVTRCAPGETAHPGYVWDEERQALVSRDPEITRWGGALARSVPRRRPPQAPDPEIVARRARVAALAGAGLTRPQIAARLDLAVHIVNSDLHRLGVGTGQRRRTPQALRERREKVRVMRAREMSRQEIADHLGVPLSTIRSDLDVLRREEAA